VNERRPINLPNRKKETMAKAEFGEVAEREIILTLTETEAFIIKWPLGSTYGFTKEVDSAYGALNALHPRNVKQVKCSKENGKIIINPS
jgi:hypothetical protein